MNYQSEEEKILNEVPYNPTKHFLFDLPEILHFFIKILVLVLIAVVVSEAMVKAMTDVLIEKLPAWCEMLK